MIIERVVKLINKNASKSAEELKNKLIGEVDIWLKGGILMMMSQL